MEETALKTLKKHLKEVFAKISEDKDTFDESRDSLQKHRILQSTEKLMSSADEGIRKY